MLLVSGSLGIDITRDPYASTSTAAAFAAMIGDEMRSCPRVYAPRTIAPFGAQPVVLAISAGARHAAVIAIDPDKEAPRLYCAGRGWLGEGDHGDAIMLLPAPVCRPSFVRVGGALASEDSA